AELVDHRPCVLHRASQIARTLGAPGAAAEVALEDFLGAGRAPGVDPQVEAEVHRAHDRLRVAPFGLAPAIEHLALVLPVVGTDVGAAPSVRALGGVPERA